VLIIPAIPHISLESILSLQPVRLLLTSKARIVLESERAFEIAEEICKLDPEPQAI